MIAHVDNKHATIGGEPLSKRLEIPRRAEDAMGDYERRDAIAGPGPFGCEFLICKLDCHPASINAEFRAGKRLMLYISGWIMRRRIGR